MRKFLVVMAVGLLVLTAAVPAMALDFKFGSEYRVRMYESVNIAYAAGTGMAYSKLAGTNPRGVQLRVRPRFDVSDDNGNIQATLRLEIGDIEFGNGGGAQGSTNDQFTIGAAGTAQSISPGGARVGAGGGGSAGADGVNVETKWAYIDFAMPFSLPARVRAGIQPWYLPKGLIVDEDFAGLRIYGSVKPVSYDLAWYRASGGPALAAAPAAPASAVIGTSNTLDNNLDYYQVKADVALAPWINPGVYFVYGDNRVQCSTAALAAAGCTDRERKQIWFGLTATGKAGNVTYDFDWIYGAVEGGTSGAYGANINTPTYVAGWAADAAVHFPVGPVKVNLAVSYGTGDKQKGFGDSSSAFPTIAPGWNGAGGGFEMIGGGGAFDAGAEFTQDGPTNLWMLGGWVDYNVTKALALKLAYGYAGFASKKGNCTAANVTAACYGPAYAGSPTEPMAGRSALGQELSLRADYTVWTGFKLQGQMGWLVPTKGDTAAEYILQMLYNF